MDTEKLIDRMAQHRIFKEVQEERVRQSKKWGGASHDQEHSPNEWVIFITGHAVKGVYDKSEEDFDREKYRKQMIRVAALAFAAVEAYDMTFGNQDNSPKDEQPHA